MSPDDHQSMTGSFSLWVREYFPRVWGRYWLSRAVGAGYREVLERRAPGHAGLRSMICALHQWSWFCSLQALPAQIVAPGGGNTTMVVIALPEGVPLARLRELHRLGREGFGVLEPLVRETSGHPVIFMESGAGSALLSPMQAVIGNKAALREELGPLLWAEVDACFSSVHRALNPCSDTKHSASPVGVFRHEATAALQALHRFNQIVGAVYAGERHAQSC